MKRCGAFCATDLAQCGASCSGMNKLCHRKGGLSGGLHSARRAGAGSKTTTAGRELFKRVTTTHACLSRDRLHCPPKALFELSRSCGRGGDYNSNLG